MLKSDQAKALVVKDLFAGGRYYLVLDTHFSYLNGRHKAAPESIQTVRHGNLAMLRSEPNSIFYLLNKSLAADPDRLRLEIVSYPQQGGHKMTVGAGHGFSALDHAFCYRKAASKSLNQLILMILIKRSIGYVGPTPVRPVTGK